MKLRLVLVLNDGTSNEKFSEICQESKHNVRVAYNNEAGTFLVENGKMVDYGIHIGKVTSIIASESHILTSFFKNYHITPTWINCNYTWGWFDEETGHWTGAVGKVKKGDMNYEFGAIYGSCLS